MKPVFARKARFFALALVALCLGHSVRADYATTIDPKTTWGTWEGWGTSLCWWANVFGNRDDIADLLFTTNTVHFNGSELPGLGFNIARYNAGACSTNSAAGTNMVVSPRIPKYRQISGFWLNGDSSDPTSTSWDWTVDANQRAMLQKAKARGANQFELFSNSPMWWMCSNHNPSGAVNGNSDNLPPSQYQNHAIYMATIAQYAAAHWGITFTSVEPFNEPIADWWKATNNQEGCHFEAPAQAAVLRHLRSELDKRGLRAISIAASDESHYDQAVATWRSFDSATRALVGRVNVHGYQYAKGNREALYSEVAGKKLWNSEYGEADATGMSLATNLTRDFRHLHMTAWCYWQPLDARGWGLISTDLRSVSLGRVNPKYYVLAQYCRHIHPGMTIIDSGDENTVAAYDPTAHKLVLVTANRGPAQTIQYSLSNFSNPTAPIKTWLTETASAGAKYAATADLSPTNKTFTATIPANSVQTFEIKDIGATKD